MLAHGLPSFVREQAEAQRRGVTCAKSHSETGAELSWSPGVLTFAPGLQCPLPSSQDRGPVCPACCRLLVPLVPPGQARAWRKAAGESKGPPRGLRGSQRCTARCTVIHRALPPRPVVRAGPDYCPHVTGRDPGQGAPPSQGGMATI